MKISLYPLPSSPPMNFVKVCCMRQQPKAETRAWLSITPEPIGFALKFNKNLWLFLFRLPKDKISMNFQEDYQVFFDFVVCVIYFFFNF